jgi:hypothetical protein
MFAVVRIDIPTLASQECHGWGLSNFARQYLGTPFHKETRRYCSWLEPLNQQGVFSAHRPLLHRRRGTLHNWLNIVSCLARYLGPMRYQNQESR